jgi:hypothetical protein
MGKYIKFSLFSVDDLLEMPIKIIIHQFSTADRPIGSISGRITYFNVGLSSAIPAEGPST